MPSITSYALAVAAATVPLATAHYTFSGLVVNGAKVGSDWQYIREHTHSYQPTKGDAILDDDFRCNTGAGSGTALGTETYEVKVGDSVAMKQAYGGTGMAHPGPASIYMSQATDGDAASYAGDGEWFKVYQELLCTEVSGDNLQNSAWCSYMDDRIGFTVPDLPSGEYLVRAEHIALHGAYEGEAEFYYSCAQISISDGTADSISGETVSIPGVYQTSDAAINFNIWNGATSYPYVPGSDVISGGETEGSADGS